MKTLSNIFLTTEDGKPMFDALTKKELNVLNLLLIVLNNAKYNSREDQRKADRIYNKLEDLGEVETIDLEDAEFDLIYKYCKDYPVFLQGRTFLPFLDELDKASN